MAKYIIVANWKMNPPNYKEAEDLIKKVLISIKKLSGVDVVFCPPFIWLTDFSHKNKSSAYFGAQDVFYENEGAFTGEISPLMLKNSKVDYVILGHSERRIIGETDEIINKKVKAVLKVGLKTILCVGEKEGQEKSQILEEQIMSGLKNVSSNSVINNVILAYEPVWAIGTGKNCSVDETMSSVLLIRNIIRKLYNRGVADKIKILYGGSVTFNNSSSYLKDSGVNGLLVGGASLNSEDFIKIIKSAS